MFGWLMFGARFDLAYLDKGIEVALISLLLLESWIVDGGPLGAVRHARRVAGSIPRLKAAASKRTVGGPEARRPFDAP